MKTFKNQINWTRINCDINGNARIVCHFLAFKTPDNLDICESYEWALIEAKKIGGSKFHNKQYGGGIVFQSWNIERITELILIQSGKAVQCHRPPTKSEIKFGHGATHYRTFLRSEIINRKGELKKWFKTDDDKLNYSTK
jgi:hypothetical protein